MKKVILLISLIALSACSSAEKEEEVVAEPADMSAPAPTTTEPAPEPAPPAADPVADYSGGDFPDVEGTERSGATCTNGSDSRMVSVIDTSAGPCGVVYTKAGNKKTIAYAKHDMSFCDKVFDNVKGNLSGAGFDCGGDSSPVQEATSDVKEKADEVMEDAKAKAAGAMDAAKVKAAEAAEAAKKAAE